MNLRNLILFWISTLSAQALEIDNHDPATHDRFSNNPSFIGNSLNWSGIGRATTGTSGKGGHWVTMISSNVFLSAHHYHAPTGTTLSFYPNNDPTVTPITRTIAGAQRIGSTDLWIGHLNHTLPNNITHYEWIDTALTAATFTSSILANENALVTGITTTNVGYGADKRTSMAVGRNIINDFSASLTVGTTSAPALQTVYDLPSDSNFINHETQLASGDSGAPLFINDGGTLLLIGINWAIGQVDIDPNPVKEDTRNVSFYSYLGNHSSQIQQYVDTHATAVPEPSIAFTLLLSFTTICFKRNRGLKIKY